MTWGELETLPIEAELVLSRHRSQNRQAFESGVVLMFQNNNRSEKCLRWSFLN